MLTIIFRESGEFEACRAAERWCDDRGIAVGEMQAAAPRGLLLGYYRIAKWRNLNDAERKALDGRMTGDMRNGPVTIALNGVTGDYRKLGKRQREHFCGDGGEA